MHIGTQGQSVSVTLVTTVTSSGLHVPESSPVHTCSLSPSPAPAVPNQVNFKSMLYSINGRPVYWSLPRTVPGSLELLTCLYLLSSFLTILLIDSSDSSTFISLVPGLLSPSNPAKIETVIIQQSFQRTDFSISLICDCSPRSPISSLSINLLSIHLPVCVCPVCDTGL